MTQHKTGVETADGSQMAYGDFDARRDVVRVQPCCSPPPAGCP